MEFTVAAYLNNKLSIGKDRAEAIIQIKGVGLPNHQAEGLRKRFLIMIDNSTSMEGRKLVEAKSAARQIVDKMPENMEFSVIVWNTSPTVLVPFVSATSKNKRAADHAISRVYHEGATYMSNLLNKACDMFLEIPGTINTGLLLTDGENEKKDQNDFLIALERCKGLFCCHSLGFGDQWDAAQLRLIEAKTAGSARGIREGGALIENFNEILANAQNKGIGDLKLRLRMPEIVQLIDIEQSFPRRISLIDRISRPLQGINELVLGEWGDETRAYLATFKVEPQTPNLTGNLLFKPMLAYTDPDQQQIIEVKGNSVMVFWTSNDLEAMAENPTVMHYKGQTEKTTAKQEGVEAYRSGNDGRATVKFERVLQIAIADQDQETIKQLSKLGEINETMGTIKLHRRGQIDNFDLSQIDVESTCTVQAKG